jgi:anti-sigma-K factor RskA
MIFATTHDAGERIFSAVQDRARAVLPEMIEAERKLLKEVARTEPRLLDFDADLQKVAADPARWARLYRGPAEPYATSTMPPDRGIQGTLL